MSRPWFRQRLYVAFLIAGVVLSSTTACNREPPQAVELVSGNKTFTLPSNYQGESKGGLLIFGFHYPSMQPTSLSDAPANDQVNIYLSRVRRPDTAASAFNQEWPKRLGPQYDPELPGKEYGGIAQGPYQIYFSGAPEDIKKTIYLFYAADKQLVRAEIPGDWAFMSKAFRSIDQDFDLKYTFAKPIRTDLVQLDKDISDFLKQHIHTTP